MYVAAQFRHVISYVVVDPSGVGYEFVVFAFVDFIYVQVNANGISLDFFDFTVQLDAFDVLIVLIRNLYAVRRG